MQVAILFALIVLNGVFAMSEIALVTARKSRLQHLIDEGDPAAIAAAKLGADPTRFLSTIQIGITTIGVLNGVVGESSLAQPLTSLLQRAGVPAAYAGYAGTGIVVALITYFTIVLGELVPKRLAQSNPEAVARFVARPIGVLARLSTPFVWLLSASTHLVLRMLGTAHRKPPSVTEEEIHAVLAEGSHIGVIEKYEHAMVRNVFRLDDRNITSLMVPRGDLDVLDLELPFEDNLRIIEETDHHYYPVTRGGMDNLVGIVPARRLLAAWVRSGSRDIEAHIVAPLFVPETVTGMELLEHFRDSGRRAAFVVDEYGEVLGLVTLFDVLEAITGEFRPRNAEAASATLREDGSWLLDGMIALPDLKDRLELRELPDEERGHYHTLGGMLFLLFGRLPMPGDKVRWQDWEFEIVDLDGRKIDKVIAKRLPVADAHGGGGAADG